MPKNEIDYLREHMDERLDAIEKLLNLSLMTAIMDQMDKVCQEDNPADTYVIDEIQYILDQYHLVLYKEERYGNKTLIYIKSLEQLTLSKVRLVSFVIKDSIQNMVPVFVFERFSGTQRKKLLEEHISFYVPEKELYIVEQEEK